MYVNIENIDTAKFDSHAFSKHYNMAKISSRKKFYFILSYIDDMIRETIVIGMSATVDVNLLPNFNFASQNLHYE